MTDLRQQLIRSLAEEIGPVRAVTDSLQTEQEKRWAWLIRDGEKLRKEREGN